MKFVFVSNYYNHHQETLCDELYKLSDGEFCFLETQPMEAERIALGWGEIEKPIYVRSLYDTPNSIYYFEDIITDADIVLYEGSTRPLVQKRLEKNKLTFLYSERVFKKGYEVWKLPIRLYTWHRQYGRYSNHYLLAASAYAYADYSLTLNFIGKAFKWGYYPKTFYYDDVNKIVKSKKLGSILWVARYIPVKHPEVAIQLAKQLKEREYEFKLTMIGAGALKEEIRTLVRENNLSSCVDVYGSVSPSEVRQYMEKSQIFIFTSDFWEGWGAVLNEAMNSACAVVSSHAVGACPYLISEGNNGLIYKNGSVSDLTDKVAMLLSNIDLSTRLGINAYKTIIDEWNGVVAAKRLVRIAKEIEEKKCAVDVFKDGPCSKATVLKNNWY